MAAVEAPDSSPEANRFALMSFMMRAGSRLRAHPAWPQHVSAMYQSGVHPDGVARSMTVQQFSIMPVQRHCPAPTNTHRTGSDQIWEQEVAGSNPASPTTNSC